VRPQYDVTSVSVPIAGDGRPNATSDGLAEPCEVAGQAGRTDEAYRRRRSDPIRARVVAETSALHNMAIGDSAALETATCEIMHLGAHVLQMVC
jgi:hypothetical protein